MRTLMRSLVLALAGGGTVAYAAESAQSGEGGFLLFAFLGFFALIILFQLIPGLAMFWGMLKGVFSSPSKNETRETAVDK